jgi:predicted Zn-dependent peptidase
LDENFVPALRLFEELLAAPTPDENALKELIADILKIRRDNKKNKGLILRGGLVNYAKYGEKSPFTNILSEEELLKIKPEELISLVTELNKTEHRVLYYGPQTGEQLAKILEVEHKTPATLKKLPAVKKFVEKEIDQTVVYWANYDMVQAEIIFLSKSIPFTVGIVPQANLFNEYFGGGMSSIVFTELRESKALAYAVSSRYSFGKIKDQSNYVSSYIGTQADKLAEAMKGMNELLNNLPESATLFENSKKSIISSIETERIIKADVLFNYENALKLGINYDIRKEVYEKVKTFTFADVKKFQETYVANKKQAVLVIGSKDKLNFEELKKYGEVKEIGLKELFGY